ncbi:hypothetical protein [Cochleicola gelatinilyticus]|uniref:Uncharacterized protein n=1 Tax=Cochleicola gelatinilyticus TaxID=1763537 RepID=A0A167ID98_9FLAO|nr:hypothetical protein [Cochleicola gelatinilyticus]OAB79543.1 hypothetical protein ULVI_01965 [Cochleicola gelatinilyticus]
MNRYLILFVGVLAIAGLSMVQFTVPNQEIIVQFGSSVVSSEEASDAVLVLKEQLQELGADNIYVQKRSDGSVKISYFSTIDVSSVKHSLLKEKQSALGIIDEGKTTNFPFNDSSETFKISVYEIQNGDDFSSSLNGCAIEIEHKNVRFYKPILLPAHTTINEVVATPLKQGKNVAGGVCAFKLTKGLNRGVPEGRAGPLT